MDDLKAAEVVYQGYKSVVGTGDLLTILEAEIFKVILHSDGHKSRYQEELELLNV